MFRSFLGRRPQNRLSGNTGGLLKMSNFGTKSVVYAFVAWRVLLVVVVFLAIVLLPAQEDFLGGGRAIYESHPWIWGWINFDGEHYLSIARFGYKPLTYFFFPLYPLLVRMFAVFLGGEFWSFAAGGLIFSNLFFLGALLGFVKVMRRLKMESGVVYALALLLLFPTSFYFAAFYTESLFLFLVVWCFYFALGRNWIACGVVGLLATATRVVGLAIFPAILWEWWRSGGVKRRDWGGFLSVMLAPLGLAVYMYYLHIVTGDPLEFLHNVGIYGEQRSASIVLLPRVFYRYFFKIIPSLSLYWPTLYVTFLEIVTGSLFLLVTILGFGRLRMSLWIYMVLAYLVPTFSGSFSSFPRYALVLFPGFILMGEYLERMPRVVKWVVFVTVFCGLCLACGMFIRGYWIA